MRFALKGGGEEENSGGTKKKLSGEKGRGGRV